MVTFRSSRAGVLGTLVAALALSACADEGEGPADQRRAVPDEGRATHTVTPARYRTDVTFVPFPSGGRRLHYRFRHATSSDRLERDYGGWLLADGGAWRPSLALRDTLPVPRAGWRVLPAPGLRVVAGPAGALTALVRRDTAAPFRLELGRTLARWESPTGQRELFRLAELADDAGAVPGLAVERRSALAAEAPSPSGLYGFLLVADSTGEGFVILRHGGTPPGRRPPDVDTTAVAHGWTGGRERTWPEVTLEIAGDPDGDGRRSPPPGGWEVTIPAAGVRGRLEPGPVDTLVSAAAPASGDGARPGEGPEEARLYALSGTLTVFGEARRVRGIGVEAGRP